MKKILTPPAGIVLLITILIAVGCTPAKKIGSREVNIYLIEAYEENGNIHLKMSDSNDSGKVVVDNLETLVKRRTKVIWTPVDGSGIENIVRIGPKTPGKIIKKDAEKIPNTKKLKLKIPINAKPGKEKYDIVFVDKNSKTWTIDPYLKIPDE